MPNLDFNISLQVQSAAQYKYLYKAVAAYAKRIRKEKTSKGLLKYDDEGLLKNVEYVIEDPSTLG